MDWVSDARGRRVAVAPAGSGNPSKYEGFVVIQCIQVELFA